MYLIGLLCCFVFKLVMVVNGKKCVEFFFVFYVGCGFYVWIYINSIIVGCNSFCNILGVYIVSKY